MNHVRIQLLALLLCPLAFAGGKETGNGGHAIVCRDGSNRIQSVEVLDLYEARTNHKNWTLNLGGPTLSYPEKIKLALGRLARFSPKRAQYYQDLANSFETEALFKNGVVLELIPDAANVDVPTGCKLEQLVNQKKPLLEGDPRYVVNGDLWDAMNNDQRAGIILHEITYREMLEYGHKYSISARWIVGFMATTAIDRATPKEFRTSIQNLAVKKTDLGHYTVSLGGGQSPNETDGVGDSCRTPDDIIAKSKMEFYPSGNLKDIFSINQNEIGEVKILLSPQTTLVISGPGYVFEDDIHPKVINAVGNKTLTDSFHQCTVGKDFQLSPNGNLGSVKSGACQSLKVAQIPAVSGDLIQFSGPSDYQVTNGWVQTANVSLSTPGTIKVIASENEIHVTALGETSIHDQRSYLDIKANSTLINLSGDQYTILARQVLSVDRFPLTSLYNNKFEVKLYPINGNLDNQFEWNNKGQWTAKGLAFDFNQPKDASRPDYYFFSMNLFLAADGKDLPVFVNDYQKLGDLLYRIKTQKETKYGDLFLKPQTEITFGLAPNYARLTSLKATLSRDSKYHEDVMLKQDTEIEIGIESDQEVSLLSGVLAQDTMLASCDNLLHHKRLFKAGTKVQEHQWVHSYSGERCYRSE